MFTFIGIVLLLLFFIVLGANLAIPNTIIETERVYENGEYVTKENKILNPRKPKFFKNKVLTYSLLGLGIIFVLIPYLFFFASPGYQYFLVYPNGNRDAVLTEGIKWRGFAKITEWDKYIDIKVVDDESSINKIDEIEGVMKPIPVRFIDQVTAKAKVSARFQLPTTKEQFITLALEFRSLPNLIQTTLIPTIKEVMSNTGYMFAAQDYISGEAQNFRTTFEEQLSDGSYVVEKRTLYDTIYEPIQKLNTQRLIKTIKTSYTVNKVLVNGVPKRIPNEISKNGIIVAQVVVDNIDLEPVFKKRLEAQRDESAKRQLEQQKIKTAKDARARILAEGERDKAAERVAQEKAQIKTLITIETNLKKEETNKKLAQVQYETEVINAKKLKVSADAEAYVITKKVKAGITPEVKLQMQLDAQVAMMEHLSKTKFPTTYIVGGSNKSSDPLNALITAAMAKQLKGN